MYKFPRVVLGLCAVFAITISDGSAFNFSGLLDKAKSAATNIKNEVIANVNNKQSQGADDAISVAIDHAKNIAQMATGALSKSRDQQKTSIPQKVPEAQKISVPQKTPEIQKQIKTDIQKQMPSNIVSLVDSIFVNQDKIARSKYIDASGLGLTDEYMPYFAERLKNLSQKGIEKLTLNLSGNMVTAVGLVPILETLANNVKVVSILDFSKNRIGDEGAILLANCLQNLAIVNSIILSNTGLTGIGAISILTEIAKKDDSLLELLDLSNNMISNDHWPTLAEKAKSLKHGILEDGINLSGNILNLPQWTDIPPTINMGL
jgi:hypothetical protein